MLTRPDLETKGLEALRSEARSRSLAVSFTMACIVMAAINLRPALTSIATMVTEIQQSLGLSGVWIGVLTTMPVLCFGIFGPLAPLLSAKLGLERAIALLLMGLAAGLALRVLPQSAALFASTLLAGAAIGMAGVLLPVVIRRRFPKSPWADDGTLHDGPERRRRQRGRPYAHIRRSLAIVDIGTGELEHSCPRCRLCCGAPSPPSGTAATGTAPLPRFSLLLRDRLAWYVTAFMGLQAGLAFIVLGWLPTLLRDRGLDVLGRGRRHLRLDPVPDGDRPSCSVPCDATRVAAAADRACSLRHLRGLSRSALCPACDAASVGARSSGLAKAACSALRFSSSLFGLRPRR